VGLAREKGIPFVEDLGSGSLLDLSIYGLREETPVPQVIKAGADIVTFSGDKLLGGPQAGIIIGKKDYINKMKHNQLTRALRIDKFTIAALEATLREYLQPETAVRNIPLYRMLTTALEELGQKGEHIKKALAGISAKVTVNQIDTKAQIGGGSLPGQDIPSVGLTIKLNNMTAEEIELAFRSLSIPILGYIEKDNYILDMRTLLPGDEDIIIKSITELVS
jgi:L-seryl-tRNA(Ser) seleniumtransferase